MNNPPPLLDVIAVTALPDHRLHLVFENGEQRVFDMRPHLGRKPYLELLDVGRFEMLRVAYGTCTWPGGVDISPETLYDRSVSAEDNLRYEVSAQDGVFVARCLDVEVASDGDTEAEAVANLREALALYFDVSKKIYEHKMVNNPCYAVNLTPADEGGFVVTCRDLPQLITQGDDRGNAQAEAADAMDEVLVSYQRHQIPFPIPSELLEDEYLVSPAPLPENPAIKP